MTDLETTRLFEYHKKNAHMEEFAGYEMPISYTNIADEHMIVRNSAGIFDVSHMGRIEIQGENAQKTVDLVIPSDIESVEKNNAIYTTLCNDNGGIIDDLIIYKKNEKEFLLIVNASNVKKDMKWIEKNKTEATTSIENITNQTSMIALQGPNSKNVLDEVLKKNVEIKRFEFFEETKYGNMIISRTGYTGEDGYELIIFDNEKIMQIWNEFLQTNIKFDLRPCGLGARDTLRIEAGFPIYGKEIHEEISPVEAGLKWIISNKNKRYIGCETIKEKLKNNTKRKRIGVKMFDRGIPRDECKILDGNEIGIITSGTFSPLLKNGIALGYIDQNYNNNQNIFIDIRGVEKKATIVNPPFYDQKEFGHKREK